MSYYLDPKCSICGIPMTFSHNGVWNGVYCGLYYCLNNCKKDLEDGIGDKVVLTIDETLDHYMKAYPRSTRRWMNKILGQMYHNPMFPEGSKEQEFREEEEERHSNEQV